MAATGNFARLFKNFPEVEKPLECNVTGHLPRWLSGNLLRNGPGTFKIGDTEYNHWFDGLAYIQKYHFEDGKMFYSAKHLKSDAYKLNHAANRIVVGEFGTAAFPDPCKSIFQRFFSFFEERALTDNGLVNFVQCGDRIFATTETPRMNEVDVESLETKEKIVLSDYVAVNTATAHHHYDSEGNIYNVGSRFGRGGAYVFVRTENTAENAFKNTSIIGSVPMSSSFYPSYYHSFGMSEQFLIFFECPLRMNALKILSAKLTGNPFLDSMEWDSSLPVNVHLVNRVTGEPFAVPIKSSAFFTFHHANAYEKDGHLIVDFCKVLDGRVVGEFNLENMRSGEVQTKDENKRAKLHRMIIPLNLPTDKDDDKDILEHCKFANSCKAYYKTDGCLWIQDTCLCEIPMELPRYNYSHNTKPYKYCYGSVLQNPDFTAIVKVDVDDKTHLIWQNDNKQQMCGEPVFVADPNGADEDDGVILSPILSVSDEEQPFMLVLNAKDLSEVARCHVPAPTLLAMGFHGHFVQ